MRSKRIQGMCVFAGPAALLATVALAGQGRFQAVAANGIAFLQFPGLVPV